MNWIAKLLLLTMAGAAQAQTITYGDLMVEDQKNSEWKSNQYGVIGGYDVTNPYLNTYSMGIRTWRKLNRHFSFGSDILFYATSPSRYNSSLEKDLRTFGVSAAHDKPSFQINAMLAAHVMQGRVNLFSRKALPFRFDLRAGPSWISLDRGKKEHGNKVLTSFGGVTWGLGPIVQVSDRFAVEMGFDQDIQQPLAGQNAVYRNRLSLAVHYSYDLK